MSPAPPSPTAARWIRRWLIVLGLMVYAMILIGGATRLTDSGLSITEWEPIKGSLPPLSAEAWVEAFDKYKQTAEFKLQNASMDMAAFKTIYWWEWGHRFFGRMIGLVAVLGLAIFAAKRWLNRTLATQLVGLVALGGLQGAIGWWMVSSGIGETTRIDVAPYRLMTHFMLALVIIAIIGWLWLSLRGKPRVPVARSARWAAITLLALVLLQMAAGALVAGLDAGRSYTDWPLMDGEFIPTHYFAGDLGLRSLFEGREATQFNHRLLAYVLWAGALAAAWVNRKSPNARGFAVLAGLITLQALWGIATLINAAPMGLALVHQGLGVIVTLAAVQLVYSSSASVSTLGSMNTA
jgi:cytochrome c oxidase assembly protein subunit 15